MMITRHLTTVCLVLATVFLLSGSAEGYKVTEMKIQGQLQATDKAMTVSVACRDVAPDVLRHPVYGQSSLDQVCQIVSLQVTIGGRGVSVPLVAYEDLGEPNLLGGFSVLEMDDQIVLHIEGGDGEAAYKARLVLVNGQLDRRELQTYDADGE